MLNAAYGDSYSAVGSMDEQNAAAHQAAMESAMSRLIAAGESLASHRQQTQEFNFRKSMYADALKQQGVTNELERARIASMKAHEDIQRQQLEIQQREGQFRFGSPGTPSMTVPGGAGEGIVIPPTPGTVGSEQQNLDMQRQQAQQNAEIIRQNQEAAQLQQAQALGQVGTYQSPAHVQALFPMIKPEMASAIHQMSQRASQGNQDQNQFAEGAAYAHNEQQRVQSEMDSQLYAAKEGSGWHMPAFEKPLVSDKGVLYTSESDRQKMVRETPQFQALAERKKALDTYIGTLDKQKVSTSIRLDPITGKFVPTKTAPTFQFTRPTPLVVPAPVAPGMPSTVQPFPFGPAGAGAVVDTRAAALARANQLIMQGMDRTNAVRQAMQEMGQ